MKLTQLFSGLLMQECMSIAQQIRWRVGPVLLFDHDLNVVESQMANQT
jgi:hypothetical protein